MTFDNYSKFEASMLRIEFKRLKAMGYDDKDAEELLNKTFDANMTKLLLFLIYREVSKNGKWRV